MNTNQYVNAAVRKIKCSGARKKEIKKQLLMEIGTRLEQGEKQDEIFSQMGTAKEIADSFNESISTKEQKQYRRNKALKIVILAAAALVLLIAAVNQILPKSIAIEDSVNFNKAQVESAMKATIELLDAENYASLQESTISQLQPLLNAEAMNEAKNQIANDWGKREQFGTAYMVEIIQGNTDMVVGEITVTYENAAVTYRLTYDRDMRLAGIYIR